MLYTTTTTATIDAVLSIFIIIKMGSVYGVTNFTSYTQH